MKSKPFFEVFESAIKSVRLFVLIITCATFTILAYKNTSWWRATALLSIYLMIAGSYAGDYRDK